MKSILKFKGFARTLPLWVKMGILGGILGLVIKFIGTSGDLTNPLMAFNVLALGIGAVVYAIL